MSCVKKGDTVKINCEGKLQTGKIFFQNEKEKPLTLTVGTGAIFPKLDEELVDMEVGQTKEVILAPEDAYGTHNEQFILSIPQGEIQPDFEPEVGKKVAIQKEDKQFIGVVTEIKDELVTIDFNHPLAGQTVVFTVTIISIAETNFNG